MEAPSQRAFRTSGSALVLLVIGICALLYGAAAGIADGFFGYANGCGHGARIAGAAAAGILFAAVVLFARIPIPTRAAWAAVALMGFFVLSGASLSDDYLAGDGCRYSDSAATEDAVSAGLLTACGGIAAACGWGRRRR